jgi:thiamine biosynthesis lipoprotein
LERARSSYTYGSKVTIAVVSSSEPGVDVEESRFRVMGTDAHVLVVGGDGDSLQRAKRRLDDLESRWSRFRPDSELCRLNDLAGAPTVVSAETFALLEHALAAWSRTGGAFDPTVLAALEAAGYDRDFASIESVSPPRAAATVSVPGCGGIVLDRLVRSVTLPPDVRIDLGGIGKGYAADLVASELLDDGAQGVCVNLGGDLRVDGRPPRGDAWVIDVEDAPDHLIRLRAGAVATTSRRRRVWRRGDELAHHVIDPRTGAPAVTPWVSATVVSGDAVTAEPLAKATLLAPELVLADARLCDHGAAGFVVDEHAGVHHLADVERFLVVGDASVHIGAVLERT